MSEVSELMVTISDCVYALNLRGFKVTTSDAKVAGLQKVCFGEMK